MKEMGYRSMEYTKVQQQMNDIVGDNVKKLAQLFPAAVKDGEVDFEALKEELGQFQEVGSEKYELTWAGKKNAKKIAQEDVVGRTLKFIPEDSKDAETTENLYIEGDNLEVLKLLRQNYYGAVKMIYIDPPYNTGNDFVYNDSFEMNDDEIKENDESFSGFGEKYSINSDTQSRYHARGKFDTSQKFVMKEASYGDKELEVEISSEQKSDFEIANFIMYHTMLPRLAIFKIIKGIMKRGLLNDQDILDDVTQLILRNLNDTKASNITSYEVINGYELDERNIFEMDTITEADFEQEWRVFKARSDRSSAMNEYYKLDSEGESQFAHKLENNENVLLFTKLKKGGFVIDTPYGNYSPDWAVVCRKDALKDSTIGIYFIVETKAGKTWEDLTQVERNKIRCGELHFKAVSNNTKFDWVNGYEDFVNKFGVFDSNKGHLSI